MLRKDSLGPLRKSCQSSYILFPVGVSTPCDLLDHGRLASSDEGRVAERRIDVPRFLESGVPVAHLAARSHLLEGLLDRSHRGAGPINGDVVLRVRPTLVTSAISSSLRAIASGEARTDSFHL